MVPGGAPRPTILIKKGRCNSKAAMDSGLALNRLLARRPFFDPLSTVNAQGILEESLTAKSKKSNKEEKRKGWLRVICKVGKEVQVRERLHWAAKKRRMDYLSSFFSFLSSFSTYSTLRLITSSSRKEGFIGR
jgi:hypothetical protein